MQAPGVLIVDDDAVVLRLCEKALERAGYTVASASNPYQALELIRENRFDLLLVDILMPQMDGFELIEEARNCQTGIAVLVMTGFGTVETAIEALRRGVDGLILKPFQGIEDLLNAIQQALLLNQQKQDAGRLHVLRPLFDVSEALISETNPNLLLEQILAAALQLLQAAQIGIFQRPGTETEMRLLAARGGIAWRRLQGKRGFIETLLKGEKRPYSTQDSRVPVLIQQFLAKFELRSAMSVEVSRAGGDMVFFAGRDQREPPFIESDYERFVILARQSAIAFENAKLYEDLRRSLKRVEESQLALVQSEKMAAAGRLIASVAHEINNPLQAVRNCLHLATRGEVPDDQKGSYLEMAQKEMDRLESTVERMLDFYRPGRADREWVDVCWLIERVLQFLGAQLRKHDIVVHTHFQEDLPKIFAIREQLQQVILNILLNAIDVLEDSGRKKEIWIDAVQKKNNLRIRIEDSGEGVSPEIQSRIFEPFFSSKMKGTGLGLAISYGFIEAQHGTLSLEPGQHGSGACFEIVLPFRGKHGRKTNSGG
ncbi:MAG: response regulator [Anaerolineae bacterium]|nr:response regulator [Anaerolineae bacterium]